MNKEANEKIRRMAPDCCNYNAPLDHSLRMWGVLTSFQDHRDSEVEIAGVFPSSVRDGPRPCANRSIRKRVASSSDTRREAPGSTRLM